MQVLATPSYLSSRKVMQRDLVLSFERTSLGYPFLPVLITQGAKGHSTCYNGFHCPDVHASWRIDETNCLSTTYDLLRDGFPTQELSSLAGGAKLPPHGA